MSLLVQSGLLVPEIGGGAAVNASLIPAIDNAYDLGSATFRWANAYAVNFVGTNLTVAAAGVISFSGRSQIQCAADGFISFYNAAGTDFTGVRLGGVTSAFPMLKRVTTNIECRLADDSGFAGFKMAFLQINGFTQLGAAGSQGTLVLADQATGATFDSIIFGTASVSFPRIKRSGATIQFRLADDSAATDVGMRLAICGVFTVGTLPTAAAGIAGAHATVTDAAAPVKGANLTGGGAVLSGAICDGTNWKAS